jgi:hypothetical protein
VREQVCNLFPNVFVANPAVREFFVREQVCNLFPNVFVANPAVRETPSSPKHEGRGCKPRPAQEFNTPVANPVPPKFSFPIKKRVTKKNSHPLKKDSFRTNLTGFKNQKPVKVYTR